MPLLLAPCGFTRLFYPQGETTAARAAGKAGVGYVLTTMSGHKLEKVAQASSGPRWYQLYLVGGREAAEAAIERARNAGFTVLVITIDTGTFGMRERDVRNGAGSAARRRSPREDSVPAAPSGPSRMARRVSGGRRYAAAAQRHRARARTAAALGNAVRASRARSSPGKT